jgi:hypothetical protein
MREQSSEIQNTIFKIYLYEKTVPDHLISQINVVCLFLLPPEAKDKADGEGANVNASGEGPAGLSATANNPEASAAGAARPGSAQSRYANALTKKQNDTGSKRPPYKATQGGPLIAKRMIGQLLAEQSQDKKTPSAAVNEIRRTKAYRELYDIINNT